MAAVQTPDPTPAGVAIIIFGLLLVSTSCSGLAGLVGGDVRFEDPRYQPGWIHTPTVPGGEPERGQRALRAYGCGACHMVPGVPGADGLVGPPLIKWAHRSYIAGQLPNTPANLVRWIRDPQAVEPGTAMPDLGVTEDDARDIAAYLYTLK